MGVEVPGTLAQTFGSASRLIPGGSLFRQRRRAISILGVVKIGAAVRPVCIVITYIRDSR
jgi:hypothetical protein